MNNAHPIFDPATHYRIELWGRVDENWLRSLDGLAEITVDNTRQVDNITVLNVHTDQAGTIGLVRRLHGLGMTILQVQVITDGGKPAEGLQILD